MLTLRATVLTFVVITSTPADAQSRVDGASPEVAARVILEAIRTGDYVGAASRVHPRRLRENRQMFDSLMRNGQATYIAQRLFQLPDSQALLALGDTAFTAGLFRFNFLLGGGPDYMRSYRGVETVATARQGPDTAHVIFRYTFPPDSLPMQSFNVETMLRCGQTWCASMLGDFRGLHRLLVQPMRQVTPAK